MVKIINQKCVKCGATIGAFVSTCGETQGDPKTKGVCLKEKK